MHETSWHSVFSLSLGVVHPAVWWIHHVGFCRCLNSTAVNMQTLEVELNHIPIPSYFLGGQCHYHLVCFLQTFLDAFTYVHTEIQ